MTMTNSRLLALVVATLPKNIQNGQYLTILDVLGLVVKPAGRRISTRTHTHNLCRLQKPMLCPSAKLPAPLFSDTTAH